MNRKRVILGALLGVLAICVVYAYLATPRLEKAPPRAADQRKQPAEKSPEVDEKESRGRIDFAYLTLEPQEFTGAQRDIFRFGRRPLVKTAPPPPIVQKEAPKPVIMPKVVPVEVVQKSLSQFTFLGFLEKGGEKTVFLSSSGDLFLVKQGEHFGAGQEFLVEQIDDKLLKVRHAGREGLIEVPLIEKQKLNAAVSAPVSVSRGGVPARPPVNARTLRPNSRVAPRPAARQEDQDFQDDLQQQELEFQDDLQQQELEFQDDVQQEDQGLQGDGNFWPARER
jgi:hypothetical protein